MNRRSTMAVWAGLTTLCLGSVAAAQPAAPSPPKGPGDIIAGAQKARANKELKQAVDKAEAQTEPAPQPAAGDPHAGVGAAAASALSRTAPNPGLPAGSVRALVLDAAGEPVAGADVVIGKLASDGSREQKQGKTGPDGTYTFSGLDVGERQAYRVSVPHQGAKYSTNPFRLPPRGGFDATLRRLDTTTSEQRLVIYVGAVSVELKDDRLKVVQQMRMVNVGQETYVFPAGGTQVKLPEGYLAFNAEEIMTDQRISEVEGHGMKVEGSVPPGQVTLLWGFDLPRDGSEAVIPIEVPWTAFAFRVLADAAPGMTLSVDDMPAAQEHGDGGRRYLVTETQRKIGEDPLKRVVIRLKGIPGPGPARWVAAGLGLLVILLGFAWRRPGATPTGLSPQQFEVQKGELLQQAAELDAQHKAGEIGPEYRGQQLAALEEKLCVLLYERSLTQKSQSSGKTAATGAASGR